MSRELTKCQKASVFQLPKSLFFSEFPVFYFERNNMKSLRLRGFFATCFTMFAFGSRTLMIIFLQQHLKQRGLSCISSWVFLQKFGFFHCVLTFNSFWYKGYSCYNSTISPISLCGMSKLYLLVEKWCFKRQFKRLFPNSKGCNIDGLDTKHGL